MKLFLNTFLVATLFLSGGYSHSAFADSWAKRQELAKRYTREQDAKKRLKLADQLCKLGEAKFCLYAVTDEPSPEKKEKRLRAVCDARALDCIEAAERYAPTLALRDELLQTGCTRGASEACEILFYDLATRSADGSDIPKAQNLVAPTCRRSSSNLSDTWTKICTAAKDLSEPTSLAYRIAAKTAEVRSSRESLVKAGIARTGKVEINGANADTLLLWCEAGNIAACDRYVHNAPYTVEKNRNFYMRMCSLGSAAACGSADSDGALERGCFKLGWDHLCENYSARWSSSNPEKAKLAADAQMVACGLKNDFECASYTTVAARLGIEPAPDGGNLPTMAILSHEEAARFARWRDRRLPEGAHEVCLVQEADRLTAAVTQNPAASRQALDSFLRKCSGIYDARAMAKICPAREGQPDAGRLVCALPQLGLDTLKVGDQTLDARFASLHFQFSYPRIPGSSITPDTVFGSAVSTASGMQPRLFPWVGNTRTIGILHGKPYFFSIEDNIIRVIVPSSSSEVATARDPFGWPSKGVLFQTYNLNTFTSPYSSRSSVEDRFSWDDARENWVAETRITYTLNEPVEALLKRLGDKDIYFLPVLFVDEYQQGIVPFASQGEIAEAYGRSYFRRFYGGEITPAIASAMRQAMLQPPGSTIEEACGYRPGVNMSAVRGEFGGLNDDRYTLSRLEGEYYQRLDWMDCAFRHYRGTLAGARDYAKSHGSARLDQPERWIATRQMEHASNVEKQFVSEQKAFGTISDQMGQLSEQLKEQRRATRAANRPRVRRETEGQRYMRTIGPEPHMECLARSTTYAAHQNCWNNWLGVDMDAVAQDYYQWHDDYEAARRAMEQQ